MPTGKVRFYDEARGFGFIDGDDGREVFLHARALPEGAVVRAGAKVEYGLADSRKGPQALSVRLVDAAPSVVKMRRMKADDMAVVVEDLVKFLDGIGTELRRGRYPDNEKSRRITVLLRKVADEFDV